MPFPLRVLRTLCGEEVTTLTTEDTKIAEIENGFYFYVEYSI